MKIFLAAIVALSLFLLPAGIVKAQWCPECDVTSSCESFTDDNGQVTEKCSCSVNNVEKCRAVCGPGQFVVNETTTGCRDIGDGGDDWTCFPAGTKVSMAGEGEKNIEDVVAGDRILSQAEDGTRSVSTVSKLDQPVRGHMCRLDFSDGDTLKLTNEHPLMTEAGWKSITLYKEDAALLTSSRRSFGRM